MQTYNQEWLEVVEQLSGGMQPETFGDHTHEYGDADVEFNGTYGRGQVTDFDEYNAEGGWGYDAQDVGGYEPGMENYDEEVRHSAPPTWAEAVWSTADGARR